MDNSNHSSAGPIENAKGFKAFDKGLVCRGKQYAENTVFEESSAEICKRGMHYCTNPFDVLDYYDLVNGKGEIPDFAAVESLEQPKTDDGRKFCTAKLKVGAKLSFGGFVTACVEYLKETTKLKGNAAKMASSGNAAQMASSGNAAKMASSGYAAQMASSGNAAKMASSGDAAQMASSGDAAKMASSGYAAKMASSGYAAQMASSGNAAQMASSGDAAKMASSGNAAKMASSGYAAQMASSGNAAKMASSGYDCVICCAGNNSIAKAKKGSWITLAEWKLSEEKGRPVPVCVKTEFVDGERIQENTWYRLQDGEFTAVDM